MIPTLSLESARRLRPDGAFHAPPSAQPLRSRVELIVENATEQPELILRDMRREISWHVTMSPVPGAAKTWTASILLPSVPTIVHYHFQFPDGSTLHDLRQVEGRNTPIYGGWEGRPFQIGVYDPLQIPPEWTQSIVVYQVFPDRFANGDTSTDRVSKGVYGQEPLYLSWNDAPEQPPRGRDFYGGDLRGLIERLDYLADLGVECIYLTPIFESPSNHRYDTLDYFKIDPMLGAESDLVELVDKAHSRNTKIVLDAVFNHCSSDSRYFRDARQNRESPYYRWFTFKEWPIQYEAWFGLGHMPELVECPEVEDFFIGANGVANYWLQRGIDGWRTDVTHFISDEFWRRFRRSVRETNPTAYLIAEEWEDATRYVIGDTFDATMNYRFCWAMHGFFAYDVLTPSELDDRLETYRRDTPPPALLSQWNVIDSHDTGRVLTICKDDTRRLFQMIAFQLAYPGCPMIYYGDEVGLTGDNPESGRKAFRWDNLSSEISAFYRHALAVRKESMALRLGTVETVVIDDTQRIYAFVRRCDDEAVYAAFNGSDSPVTFDILLRANASQHWQDILAYNQPVTTSNGHLTFELPLRGAAWYIAKE